MTTCERRGCSRKKTDERKHGCCAGCGAVAMHYAEANNLADALGPTAATDEYITAVLEFNKQYERVNIARKAIKKAAAESGISREQWLKLIYGNAYRGA